MQTDEQQIRDVVATWLAATRAGDVEAVLDLMTEDVVFLVPGAAPMVGKQAFGASLRAVLAAHVIDSSSRVDEVTVAGDMAYCRTQLTVTVTSRHGNTPMVRSGPTLSIFRRGMDDRWRLARDANMLA